MSKSLNGPKLEGFTVGSWCPTPDGSGKPEAVAITVRVENLGDLVLRLKSPERVDEVIRLLQQYKKEVWPEPTVDGAHRHNALTGGNNFSLN